jgi:biotin/methionine sulfoxide reductase
VLLKDFVNDPQRHPLTTPSGKIELFSRRIDGFGYDDCPGHASWIAPDEWLGAARAARFPLHLLSPQPANRLHSQLDSVGASQRDKSNGREVATLARADAKDRGIHPGDTVRLFNDRGACLVTAALSDTLAPGVVVLPTGAWYTPADPNDDFTPDLAGNPNVLTRDARASRLSQGPAPNSCLIEAVVA